ncbi:hypothetical protein AOXY_G36335 [Acipenser oxyrinchus oxyrinchus]|uniref:Uncharacterized protein n=1 Tax=Acipenser oxyrinchus oxyrinchus TaxID=40147 RepID=A0AAD8FRU2_ACIOX|nr:hypothetical protein AOXY_G36335 [Acipenser oxyrinchus oxyrinchus]
MTHPAHCTAVLLPVLYQGPVNPSAGTDNIAIHRRLLGDQEMLDALEEDEEEEAPHLERLEPPQNIPPGEAARAVRQHIIDMNFG